MYSFNSWNSIFLRHDWLRKALSSWCTTWKLKILIYLERGSFLVMQKGTSFAHVMMDTVTVLWHSSSTTSSSRAWTFPLTHTFADKLKLAYEMTLIVLRSVWVYVWVARLLNRLAHMKMMSLSGLMHSLEKHELVKTNREKVKVIGTSFEYIL